MSKLGIDLLLAEYPVILGRPMSRQSIPAEENQKTEIILNLESRIYQDILVVDVPEDANGNEIDRISAALSFYLKNCVSQSVIITTDDFKLADINWNFKPSIDKIYCTEAGFQLNVFYRALSNGKSLSANQRARFHLKPN